MLLLYYYYYYYIINILVGFDYAAVNLFLHFISFVILQRNRSQDVTPCLGVSILLKCDLLFKFPVFVSATVSPTWQKKSAPTLNTRFAVLLR